MAPALAQAEDSYVCVADKATGFSFEQSSGQWMPTTFKVDGGKYLLKKGATRWTWAKFGDPSFVPPVPCSVPDKAGFVFCQEFEDIRFNTGSMRYQRYYPFGYVRGTTKLSMLQGGEGSDTPLIEIGTCSIL